MQEIEQSWEKLSKTLIQWYLRPDLQLDVLAMQANKFPYYLSKLGFSQILVASNWTHLNWYSTWALVILEWAPTQLLTVLLFWNKFLIPKGNVFVFQKENNGARRILHLPSNCCNKKAYFSYSFIHSFKYLLSTYNMPSIVSGIGNI